MGYDLSSIPNMRWVRRDEKFVLQERIAYGDGLAPPESEWVDVPTVEEE